MGNIMRDGNQMNPENARLEDSDCPGFAKVSKRRTGEQKEEEEEIGLIK